MNTIPASAIVSVNPGVIGAGGSALDLNGLFLTESTRLPTGQVASFPSHQAVIDYFGAASLEAEAAGIYFLGFDNSNVKPGALLMSQFNMAGVGAWLRGASVAALTLTELKALSGTLQIVVDGYQRATASFSLDAATSPSAAAGLIADALNLTPVVAATSTASTIAGAVLTVGGVLTGTFRVGQSLIGAGVTPGTVITSLGTGTGGLGTYNLSQSSSIAIAEAISGNATWVTVVYDSVSGGFVITSGVTGAPTSSIGFATGTLATPLKLTSASGAIVSQGAAAGTPEVTLAAIANSTQNWATFCTLFDPDGGAGNAVKLLFAEWTNSKNRRYAYAAWDTDVLPTLSNDAASSMGAILKKNGSEGTVSIHGPDYKLAAFFCGMVASIDFDENQGRITTAFKHQAGLEPTITDQTKGDYLIANGYNFYGAYATANDDFVWFYPGSISGEFLWADGYINQIWLNNALQLAMMALLDQVKSLPYNKEGYGLVRAACTDPILAGVTFGAIQAGIPLSAAQAAQVRTAAGLDISGILFAQGWYLQILNATAIARGARESPPMTLWYMDGGSIQKLSLASIAIL